MSTLFFHHTLLHHILGVQSAVWVGLAWPGCSWRYLDLVLFIYVAAVAVAGWKVGSVALPVSW